MLAVLIVVVAAIVVVIVVLLILAVYFLNLNVRERCSPSKWFWLVSILQFMIMGKICERMVLLKDLDVLVVVKSIEEFIFVFFIVGVLLLVLVIVRGRL